MQPNTPAIALLLLLATISLHASTTRPFPPFPTNSRLDGATRIESPVARVQSKPIDAEVPQLTSPAQTRTNAPDIRPDLTRRIDCNVEAAWNKLKVRPEVPIPESTPFDNDPEARRAYIRYYQRGFRIGYSGSFTTCCMFGNSPIIKAMIKGHYDGQRAGSEASIAFGPTREGLLNMIQAATKSEPQEGWYRWTAQPTTGPASMADTPLPGPPTK